MNNPYDDKTKAKALETAKNLANEHERNSVSACFEHMLDNESEDPFHRWEYTSHTLAGMFIASAVYDYAWEDNTEKVDAWLQFNTEFNRYKERVAQSKLDSDYINMYKRMFNERVASYMKTFKTSSQIVRNALKNPKVKPEEVAI